MPFQTIFSDMCAYTPDTYFVGLIDKDGIFIETFENPNQQQSLKADYTSFFVEWMSQYRAIQNVHQEHRLGNIEDLQVLTSEAILLIRSIDADYFLVAALDPHANVGKAKFKLRVSTLSILQELNI